MNGLVCKTARTALDRGLKGKRLNELSGAVLEAISLNNSFRFHRRTVGDIRSKTTERNKQNATSRGFYARNDSRLELDLNRILLAFDVRSIVFVWPALTVHSQTELGLNVYVTVFDFQDGITKTPSLRGSGGFSKSSWTALGHSSRSLKVTDAKAISDQFQTLVVHCRSYRWSKHARPQLLGRLEPPGLFIVPTELSRSVGGNRSVAGERNVQCGVWNDDAVIPIVSRCRQSEVGSSTDYRVETGPDAALSSLQDFRSPVPTILSPGLGLPLKLRYLSLAPFTNVQ